MGNCLKNKQANGQVSPEASKGAKAGGKGEDFQNIKEDSGSQLATPRGAVKKYDEQTEEVIGLLRAVPLLSNLERSELASIARNLTDVHFEQGEYLMKKGEAGDRFFIITDGCADVLGGNTGNDRIATLEPRDYCGEQALLKDCKRNATIRAKMQCTCLSLDREQFKKIFGEQSDVRFAKRDAKRGAIAMEDMDAFTIDETRDTVKSEEVMNALLDAVQTNLLFENLAMEQKRNAVKHMYREDVKSGTKLISQGEQGDRFYVVQSGTFEVSVYGVGVVENIAEPWKCTGELALIYNAPRAATVTATSNAVVWAIDRGTFRKALMIQRLAATKKNVGFLKRVELLRPLLSTELALVDQALIEKQYHVGQIVFNQGDVGDKFYIIKSGTAEGIRTAEDKSEERFDLTVGNFFGERALLKNEPRTASIKAKSDMTVLCLSRNEFHQLLGPLEDILKRQADEYEKAPAERKLVGGVSMIDQPANAEPKAEICKLDELETVGILGRGAFGVVTLVIDPKTGKSYALKAIRKLQIMELGQQKHILNEKKVMQKMCCPFLVNLLVTYKDDWRVYFLLDVCLGGELFTILRRKRAFDEETARFFAGCVVEAFGYMHSKSIIYRDLKPENLVLNETGYLKVTDFGFAKFVPSDKTFTLCGTPDYLAPEIVTGQGHGRGVDWWTLGVLVYEMIASFPPFFDENPMMTYRKIISTKYKFPKYLSPESKDLINRFLKAKPTKRLGVLRGGATLIRQQPWFSSGSMKAFSWEALQKQEMDAPIKPKITSKGDLSNFDKYDKVDENYMFDLKTTDTTWDEAF